MPQGSFIVPLTPVGPALWFFLTEFRDRYGVNGQMKCRASHMESKLDSLTVLWTSIPGLSKWYSAKDVPTAGLEGSKYATLLGPPYIPIYIPIW